MDESRIRSRYNWVKFAKIPNTAGPMRSLFLTLAAVLKPTDRQLVNATFFALISPLELARPSVSRNLRHRASFLLRKCCRAVPKPSRPRDRERLSVAYL